MKALERRKELLRVLSFANQTAKEGRELFSQTWKVETKPDRTLVSEADRQLEKFVKNQLSASGSTTCTFGEEEGWSDLVQPEDEGKIAKTSPNSQTYWCIDPIDGTTNFLAKSPLWTTLIALIENDEPVAGALLLPCLNEVFFALQGEGAFFGDLCNLDTLTKLVDPLKRLDEEQLLKAGFQPCKVNNVSKLSEAHLGITNFGVFFERQIEKGLFSLASEVKELRTHSDAYGYSRVLCGGIQAMIDPVVQPYDVAIVELLFKETRGSYFSTLIGKPEERPYQSGSFLGASSKELALEIKKSLLL